MNVNQSMILDNDFPEYSDIIEQVDPHLAYVNLILRRIKTPVPSTEHGVIKLPTMPKTFWTGSLIHEAAHLVKDPIVWQNYADAIHAIRTSLSVDPERARELANIASDVICENWISRNKTLTAQRTPEILQLYEKTKAQPTIPPILEALPDVYGRIYDLKEIPHTHPDLWQEVQTAFKEPDRISRYLQLARAFNPFLDQQPLPPQPNQGSGQDSSQDEEDQEEDQQKSSGQSRQEETDESDQKNDESQDSHEQEGTKGFDSEPLAQPHDAINPTEEDMERAIEKALAESQDEQDLTERLETLQAAGSGLGRSETLEKLRHDEAARLRAFYEAKAEHLSLAIQFPAKQSRTASRIGTRKWTLSDGLNAMKIPQTLMKRGINIPLVTTQTPQTFNRFRLDERGREARTLVMSFDCSGSMGSRWGTMQHVRDMEALTFLAILRQARKINQKVGFDLWAYEVIATLPPTDPDRFNRLKQQFFERYPNQDLGTRIADALGKIRKDQQTGYLLVTDGVTSDRNQLSEMARGIKNTLVLLFGLPYEDELEHQRKEIVPAFQDAFGKDRVIWIERIEDLPKIALKSWRDWFWTA